MTLKPTNEDKDVIGRGFESWLEQLQQDLRAMAYRLAKNGPDAADLLQATCLRGLEKRRLFVHGSVNDLRNWLVKIMHNLHLDGIRRRTYEVLVDSLAETVAAESAPLASWKMVDEGALWAASRRLTPALREVYQLVAIQRLSYKAIALRLGISLATVATRMHRARLLLRQSLTAQPVVIPPAVRAQVPVRRTRRIGAGGAAVLEISRSARPRRARDYLPPMPSSLPRASI